MRHVELSNALRAAGMEIHRGEKVRGGFLFYTVGTERSRVTWTGPPTGGDCDVAFVTTSEANGGIGWPLRSLRLTLCYAVGEIPGWEAHLSEKHHEVERMEATTSERARDGRKTKSGATAAVVLLGRRPAGPPL